MTLDGVCDHTAGVPDAELHQHYYELLNHSDIILYGRKTFELMQFWQTMLENPSGEKAIDDFAVAIDRIPKLVFSNTINNTDWKSATIANQPLEETISERKQQPGADILVGSRSLIIQLLNAGLIDEFQICIHPVIEGKGMRLFDEIADRISLRLHKTKSLGSGATILYYEPVS